MTDTKTMLEPLRAAAPSVPAEVREALEKIVYEWKRLYAEELQLDEGVEQAITAADAILAALPQPRKPIQEPLYASPPAAQTMRGLSSDEQLRSDIARYIRDGEERQIASYDTAVSILLFIEAALAASDSGKGTQ